MGMRNHASYAAFALHRLSGLCLAAFLPIHLFTLSLIMLDPELFESFLSWSATPAAKASETILILLTAAHLAGGVRILAFEWFAFETRHDFWIATTVGFSIACGGLFLANS